MLGVSEPGPAPVNEEANFFNALHLCAVWPAVYVPVHCAAAFAWTQPHIAPARRCMASFDKAMVETERLVGVHNGNDLLRKKRGRPRKARSSDSGSESESEGEEDLGGSRSGESEGEQAKRESMSMDVDVDFPVSGAGAEAQEPGQPGAGAGLKPELPSHDN